MACYDNYLKRNVDFIIQQDFNKAIPIEVGIGKKDRKLVKNSIKRYKSDYGRIIFNKASNMEKDDDIIYIPFRTFSFL